MSTLLLVAAVAAQLNLAIVEGGIERAAATTIQLGEFETGDSGRVWFRLRNPGAAAVELKTLSIAGEGFALIGAPQLPVYLAAAATIDFTIAFQFHAPGIHSAKLAVNDDSYWLSASVRSGPLISLAGAGALASGSVIDFGGVERSASTARSLTVQNRAATAITIESVAVTGAGFRGPDGIPLPLNLAPGASASFQVFFEPQAAGSAEGTLSVAQRSFRLRGTGVDPPLPKPILALDPPGLRSGQQARLSIRLAAPARASGSGTLRIEPVGRQDDPIQFLAPPGRAVTFTVREGEEIARFGERPDIEFATGTSAGAILFIAELGLYTEQVAVQIAPAAVVLDSARATRSAAALDIEIAGYDNSLSASEVSFLFYGRTGSAVGRGPIRVDLSRDFAAHFAQSRLGGTFTLRALFTVTGSADLIDSVEIEIASTAGLARRSVKMAE